MESQVFAALVLHSGDCWWRRLVVTDWMMRMLFVLQRLGIVLRGRHSFHCQVDASVVHSPACKHASGSKHEQAASRPQWRHCHGIGLNRHSSCKGNWQNGNQWQQATSPRCLGVKVNLLAWDVTASSPSAQFRSVCSEYSSWIGSKHEIRQIDEFSNLTCFWAIVFEVVGAVNESISSLAWDLRHKISEKPSKQ